jgi:RNA polymerase sigma-70 factor, ECF subfamily
MQQHPDEALTRLFLHRDEAKAHAAFARIVDIYGKRLYSTIRRWTNNHEDTNDLLQETFLKVWKHRLQFEGKSAIFSWIYRIAWNETMQSLRRNKKTRTVALDDPLVTFTPNSEHYGKISGEQISAWLDEAIKILPEKQRMVFEYRYFDDLKYDEIAQLTGLSTGGLKANYFHAAAKVEEYLKAQLNH